MEASVMLSFWAISLLLVVTPGPDWAFVLGHSLRGRSLVAPLIGVAAGYLAITIVVAAGLGAVVATRPMVLSVVTVLGALVLIWIGITMLRSALPRRGAKAVPAGTVGPDVPPDPAEGGGGVATMERTRAQAPAGNLQVIMQGATVSGLNPKGLMLFIALLPQFVAAELAVPVWAQMFILGSEFILSAMIVYALLGIFARKVLANSDRGSRILSGVAGVAMIAVALGMLIEFLIG